MEGIPEDYITVEYLRDTCIQAGFDTDYLDVEVIGGDRNQRTFATVRTTEEIAATLRDIVKPGMKPKELRDAVREKHPDAHKKEIMRAAFYALTEVSPANDAALPDLHSFALSERGADHADGEMKLGKKRNKRDRAGKEGRHEAH